MDTASLPAYRVISSHGHTEVRKKISNDQHALFSLRPYWEGEVIAEFSAGTIAPEPTYLTVQVAAGKHITLQPEHLQYTNHSCDPNVFFDTTRMQLVALRDIASEEELVFFYPSTEWDMEQPFSCYCGSPRCLGTIRGAAYLSPETISRYRFTSYIQQELAARSADTKVA